jgi:ubiquinone biosynthesis O-methyltransferase
LDPDVYTPWRASDIGALADRLESRLVLELLGDEKGRRILDIGCGDGSLAIELARSGAEVTGVDASAAMIEAARRRSREHGLDVDWQVGPAHRLPFASDRFDIVVAVTILCFVDDAAPVFGEMARVLRPGGRLVIGELGKRSSWALARRVRGWLGSPLWRRARFRTEDELRALAEGAGLVVETVRGAIYFPRIKMAARLMGPFDARIARLGTFGAAFLALAATQPGAPIADSGNVRAGL